MVRDTTDTEGVLEDRGLEGQDLGDPRTVRQGLVDRPLGYLGLEVQMMVIGPSVYAVVLD